MKSGTLFIIFLKWYSSRAAAAVSGSKVNAESEIGKVGYGSTRSAGAFYKKEK